jgi:hypothetical protein
MSRGLKYKIITGVNKCSLPDAGTILTASGFCWVIVQRFLTPKELNYEQCVDIRGLNSRTNQRAEYFFIRYIKSRFQPSGI